MADETSVLVVGAGPTGLTLACVLARQGVAVRVIEQGSEFPSPRRGSRGTAYQPRTLEVFEDLGILPAVLRETWTDMRQRLYRGGQVTDLYRIAAGIPPEPEIPYPFMARPVPTWRVEELLCERLAQIGVKVETGRRLVRLAQADDHVLATVESTPTGQVDWGHAQQRVDPGAGGGVEETVRADYVVGCDGGHSTVRRCSVLEYEFGADHGFVGMVADLAADGIEPTIMRMWFSGDGKDVVLSPMPGTGKFQFLAQLSPDESGNYPEPTLELAQRLLDERADITGVRLRDLSWSTVFKVREALVDHYRDGRLFLAGDAAHIHSPVGGQGVNTGIQDAYNLGWKLGYVLNGRARPELLDSYEQERRAVARGVLTWTGQEQRVFFKGQDRGASPEPLAPAPFTPPPADAAFLRKMAQLDVGYPESFVNGGRRFDAGPSVGDRAPDARLIDPASGAGVRLFDVLRGSHFTLLMFGETAVPAGAQVAGLYPDVVRAYQVRGIDDGQGSWPGPALIDPIERANSAYHAGDRPLVLIRPDGYLAFHGGAEDGPELLAHLDKVLGPGARAT